MEADEEGERWAASFEEVEKARERLVDSFEEVEAARRALMAALDDMGRQNRRFVEHLRGVQPLVRLYDDGWTIDERDNLFAAMATFDRAFSRARGATVRLLVDQEGVSLSEVARMIGRSRQFVTRLYRTVDIDDADAGSDAL